MTTSILIVGIALIGSRDLESMAEAATAADAVTLRDGRVALGQVVEPSPRGVILLQVRRAWAEEHLPDWSGRWEEAEAAWRPRARRERLQRLEAWRRDREASPAGDALGAWIDREIDRLGAEPEAAEPPLMTARLGRGDVRSVDRRPESSRRMLRQAWRAGLDRAETMPPDDLKRFLEGRGFAQGAVDEARVDDLLPIAAESDGRWRLRRAATEVAHEPASRFVRYQGLVLPEGGAPAGPSALLSTIKGLLDDTPAEDPLAARFREVAARGRVGLVLTRLEIGPDLATVSVESTLWVRLADGRWLPASSRTATARPDALGPDAGAGLEGDPQVRAAFGLVESLGLGQVDPEIKRRSLSVGAATRQALGQARAALDRDLDAVELPVDAAPRPDPSPP